MRVPVRLFILPFALLGGLVVLAWMVPLSVLGRGRRFRSIAIGIDNALSACFGGDGSTTISRRAAIAQQKGRRWGCVLCRFLDVLDKGHCARELLPSSATEKRAR